MGLIFKCDKCLTARPASLENISMPEGWSVVEGKAYCNNCLDKDLDEVFDINKETLEDLLKLNLIQKCGRTANGKVFSYKLTALGLNLFRNSLEKKEC